MGLKLYTLQMEISDWKIIPLPDQILTVVNKII